MGWKAIALAAAVLTATGTAASASGCAAVNRAIAKLGQTSYQRTIVEHRAEGPDGIIRTIVTRDMVFTWTPEWAEWTGTPLKGRDRTEIISSTGVVAKGAVCRHEKIEVLGGDAADVIDVKRDFGIIVIEMRAWISRKSGLILKVESFAVKDRRPADTQTYEYDDVRPPETYTTVELPKAR